MLEDTWKQRACCGVCGAIRGNKLAVCPARHMYMRILSLGFGGWARTLFRHCTQPAGHPSQDMILRKVRKTEASPFAGLNGTTGEGFNADLQFFEFIDNPSRSVNQLDSRQGPRTQAVKVSNPWHPDAAPSHGSSSTTGGLGAGSRHSSWMRSGPGPKTGPGPALGPQPCPLQTLPARGLGYNKSGAAYLSLSSPPRRLARVDDGAQHSRGDDRGRGIRSLTQLIKEGPKTDARAPPDRVARNHQ